MTTGLLITLREGLEAFLVVGIILSYLGRLNLKRYNKWIYMGVFLGLMSAFGLGILFQLYYSGFESRLGELRLKITIMGFAVVVLTYMLIWMSRNSRHIKGDVEKALETAVSAGSIVTLMFMGYLAILREGFETVLFLGAVFGDSMQTPVFYGGAIGLVIALAVTIALFRGMRKIPIKMFFKVTGGLIVVIAGGLCVNMVGVMQDINLIPVLKAGMLDLSWFMKDTSAVGVFFKALFGYTHSPSIMQIMVYISYLTLTIWLLNRDVARKPSSGMKGEPASA
ncbi:MAG: FTR1 family protein [Nitrospinota bacterium]